MAKSIYLLTFNNYYNRIVKGFDTLEEYLIAAPNYQVFPGVNYKPNDGVITTFTFNTEVDTADYILVCDEYNDIISRWFIIESVRNAKGQYLLDVYRDVIYDYKNIILDAPCFIEKATLPATSKLIFNQEDFAANQIKTSETLLKDFTNCAWLVGYLSPTASIENINVQINKSKETIYIGDLEDWEFYPYSAVDLHAAMPYNNNLQDDLCVYFSVYDSRKTYPRSIFKVYCYLKQGTFEVQATSNSIELNELKPVSFQCPHDNIVDRVNEMAKQVVNALNPTLVSSQILTNVGNITKYNGQKLETEDNKIYTASLINEKSIELTDTFADGGNIDLVVFNIASAVLGTQGRHNPVKYKATATRYSLILAQEAELSATFNLDISKNYTNDIYRVICIPYPDENKEFRVVGAVNDKEEDIGPILINRETALAVAKAIMRAGGGSGSSTLVYDFQLLPYCPIANSKDWEKIEGEDYYIRLDGDTQEYGHYTLVGGNKCVVFEVAETAFSFNINHTIEVKNPKVENQLDMYRLCSPNYAAMFEFNAAKNGGVNYFNVDCNYKPYTPYIHINPNFGGLYGRDFNDPRGLILNGDFSLSSLSDAFINYELQNKNYQNMFDRQIKNMETVNKYSRKGEVAQAITGTISGVASGAMAGGMVGGGWGAAAGAVIGGGAALTGGILDVKYAEALRSEALDYTKDMYGFNLENIKAMPSTLTKVSAFNLNNKIYPVLEYYTCTEEERKAFENKIKYNGMTVGVIDTIGNYLQVEPTYIKGRIIRLENLDNDFHVAKVISEELYKGVFI